MTTATETTTPALKFERKTCGRCGGSGHYSYCQRYGTTCFGCSGRKEVLTKRGAAASEWFREQRMVATTDLKPGDTIMCGSITMGGTPYDVKCKVVEVRESSSKYGVKGEDGQTIVEWKPYTEICCVDAKGREHGKHCFPESTHLRLLPTVEHNALLAKAIEYQNSLTLAGKPRKVR